MATFAQAKALLRLHEKELLRHKNVVAVGLGHKNGEAREDWCIRVHVTKKTGRRTKDSVPRMLHPKRSSKWLPPVETDVKEVGPIRLHAPNLEAGDILALDDRGTCAAIFRDSGGVYALTCGHVASYDMTAAHNLHDGYLPDTTHLPCRIMADFNGGNVGAQPVVGECVRCSSRETPIDLALILLDTGLCTPQSSRSITGIRHLLQNPLDVGETLTVLRASPHHGAYTVPITHDTDHYCSPTFDYPTSTGIRRVTYAGLLCYDASIGNQSLAGGDSGAAVIDGTGQLVGIHMGAADTTAYGVPSDQLLGWAQTLTLV